MNLKMRVNTEKFKTGRRKTNNVKEIHEKKGIFFFEDILSIVQPTQRSEESGKVVSDDWPKCNLHEEVDVPQGVLNNIRSSQGGVQESRNRTVPRGYSRSSW